MSLPAVLKAIFQKLEQHEKASKVSDLLAGFRRVSDDLADRLKASSDARKRVKALTEAKFAIAQSEPPTPAQSLTTTLVAIRENCRDDIDKVLNEPPTRWRELSDAATLLAANLESAYALAKQELRGQPLPLFYDLLATVTEFPHAELNRIKAIDAELDKLLPQSPPLKAETLRQAQKLKQERAKKLAAVEEAVPVEVRDLLEKINARSATLAHLTPERLDWLQQKGLAAGFQVRLVEQEGGT